MGKRPVDDLLLKFIYSIVVAGKSAKFANSVMGKLISLWRDCGVYHHEWPHLYFPAGRCFYEFLENLNNLNVLMDTLKYIKSGNYNKLHKAIIEYLDSNIDLESCTPQELETIHGIGPKTSRFFVMWTRPKEKYAILDVHILRWMKSLGYNVPSATPQVQKRYIEIEQQFLKIAEEFKITPRELDLAIWEKAASATNEISE